MRYLRFVSLILVFHIVAASAQAQTGDWQAVRNLPAGAYISVKTHYRFPCVFRAATEDELTCRRDGRYIGENASSEMKIARQDVREVRFEHLDVDHGNPVIGALIGGGLGAVSGARAGTGTRDHVTGAVFVGGFCALLGAGIAWAIPIFHRKVVYRR
jgi:hypothetical protein